MNIHPLFVHFPIALLFLWSLCELVPVSRWLPQIHWQSVRHFLIVVGTLGAYVTFLTGGLAEELIGESRLVEFHSTFAGTVVIIYSIFLLEFILEKGRPLFEKFAVLKYTNWFLVLIQNRILRTVLISAAFICLVITGALGGAIVYGSGGDPFTDLILKLFGF